MSIDVSPALAHLAQQDPIMAGLIARYPQPIFTQHTDYYRALTSSIISQQLSVKAAATIEARFVALYHHFPTPTDILQTTTDQLRSIGLSRQKASYIMAIAEHTRDNPTAFMRLGDADNQTIIQELTAIKGVGVWTVHMLLLFCMARLDVLPTGDLGVRRAIERMYNLPDLPTVEQVQEIARKGGWHPYESVATRYLWLSLANAPDEMLST